MDLYFSIYSNIYLILVLFLILLIMIFLFLILILYIVSNYSMHVLIYHDFPILLIYLLFVLLLLYLFNYVLLNIILFIMDHILILPNYLLMYLFMNILNLLHYLLFFLYILDSNMHVILYLKNNFVVLLFIDFSLYLEDNVGEELAMHAILTLFYVLLNELLLLYSSLNVVKLFFFSNLINLFRMLLY